ncbi:MAG: orotate phosphoribosyltransferase [Coriobacteriia bacterium]|nr:orotate phosphoribosyltransferase [Coriobacteriia bacterium]
MMQHKELSHPLSSEDIQAALEGCQAILKGHFKLTSGLHSDTYIQCSRVLEKPWLTNKLAAEAVARLPKEHEVDLVAAPAVGGIIFGFAVASALNKDFVFSERTAGIMEFRRSFVVPEGAKVLVCEDVVTTGGSVCELIELVKAANAKVEAVVAMVDRGKQPDFGCAYHPLLTIETPSWPPEDCAMCLSNLEITTPGSRELAKSTAKS